MHHLKILINKFSLMICAFIFSAALLSAAPVPAKFFVNTLTASVGDVIEFDLKIDGSTSVPVYTVIANLEYDKNLLTLKSVNNQQGWISVPQDDVTDTVSGIIKRTAGYPMGLKQTASIYKYAFVAKAEGDAKVSVTRSSAYNENSEDLGLQNKQIIVKIGSKKEPKEVAETPTKKVNQSLEVEYLGNIGFATDKDHTFILRYTPRVLQETKGTYVLELVDINKKVVWSNTNTFGLENKKEFEFIIPANSVVAGNYILSVSTTHDNQKSVNKFSKELGAVETTKELVKEVVKEEIKVEYIPFYVYVILVSIIILWLLTMLYIKSKRFRNLLKNM